MPRIPAPGETLPPFIGLDPDAWAGNGALPSCGMAVSSGDRLQAALSISDQPLPYEPAFGPPLAFTVGYSQVDNRNATAQPQSHLGANWRCNWFAWLDYTPGPAGTNVSSSVRVSGRDGGADPYQLFDGTTATGTGTYTQTRRKGSVVTKLSATSFERRYADGSAEVYATGCPGDSNRFLLSSVRDAWGHSTQLAYGTNGTAIRLETIKDATEQQTTLQYADATDWRRVTGVTDPFGRQATFDYDAQGRLTGITDPVGITSTVTYEGTGTIVNSLTTPYGASTFTTGYINPAADGTAQGRWLQMIDPRGGKERIEFRSGPPGPAGGLPTSYYWSKSAHALIPAASLTDAHAVKTTWFTNAQGLASGIAYSVKQPLELPVFYSIEPSLGVESPCTTAGADAVITAVIRILDDGTTQSAGVPAYNSLGLPTSTVDPRGRAKSMVYAANGIDLSELRQATGTASSELLAKFENYTNHQPQIVRDAAGQPTTIGYNARGQVETITDAENKVTKIQYEDLTATPPTPATSPKFGKVKTVTAAFGTALAATTTYGYDGYGRVSAITDPESYTITLAYDAMAADPLKTLDRVVRVTYPDTTYEETLYNYALDADPAKRAWPLNVRSSRDRRGRITLMEYDSTGRVVKTTDPALRVLEFERCLCGAISKLKDANGQVTEWVRDIQMRVTAKAISGAEAYSIAYGTASGRVVKVTDAKGQTAGTQAQVANYEYFADDTLKRVFYTDVAGNPLPTPTPEVSFTYDPLRPRLATMIDGTGTTTYGYHPIADPNPMLGAGMLATIDGPLPDDTLAYTYDSLGRVSSRGLGATGTAGTTNTISYAFNDALGRLKTITDPLGTFTRTYQGVTGRVDNVQRTGGMKTVFAWEPTGDRRLTGIHYEDSSANVIAQFGYGYQFPDMTNDPTAQIRQWSQWHRGLNGTPTTQARKWDFRYDAVDQLAEAVKTPVAGGAVESSLGYGYDPAGNRNQVLENGVAQQFTVNGRNELTGTAATPSAPVRFAGTVSANSVVTLAGQPATGTGGALAWEKTLTLATGTHSLVLLATETNPPSGKPAETTKRRVNLTLTAAPAWTFGYDDNGSLLSAIRAPSSALTYEWDAANRLSAIVKDGKRSELSYDGQSRWTGLVERTGTATTAPVLGRRRFVWEGYSIAQIREYDASDTLTGVRHIFPEGEVRTTSLAQDLSTGTKLLYLRDHLGSVLEMVDASDLAVRARYDYDPYGQRTKLGGDLDCDFGFAGHYEHASGVTLAPFRGYYAPLGRWLSRDPIGEEGGINLYGYVGNSSVSRVDIDGLIPLDKIGPALSENKWIGGAYKAVRAAAVAANIFLSPTTLPDQLPKLPPQIEKVGQATKTVAEVGNTVRSGSSTAGSAGAAGGVGAAAAAGAYYSTVLGMNVTSAISAAPVFSSVGIIGAGATGWFAGRGFMKHCRTYDGETSLDDAWSDIWTDAWNWYYGKKFGPLR